MFHVLPLMRLEYERKILTHIWECFIPIMGLTFLVSRFIIKELVMIRFSKLFFCPSVFFFFCAVQARR